MRWQPPIRLIDRGRGTGHDGFFIVGGITVLDRRLDVDDFRSNTG